MSERFIKFIPSEEAMFLVTHKNVAYQNAFRLLTIIAERARRYNGHLDGLTIGQCHLGKWAEYGMSEQNYKTAKKILERMGQIKIVETNRTRKKKELTVRNSFNSHFSKNPTTGITTEGTLVELISLMIYDINIEEGNDRSNVQLTTGQRLANDKLRKNKKEKKEKNKEKELKETLGASLLADFFSSLKFSYPPINEKKLHVTNAQICSMNRLLQLHSEDTIRTVFTFAHSNSFWVAYVHTACYLEKKFDTLNLQRLKPNEIKNENSKLTSLTNSQSTRKFEGSRVLKGNNTIEGDS